MPFWGGSGIVIINQGGVPPTPEFPRKRTVVAGENLAANIWVYIDSTDTKAYHCDCTDENKIQTYGITALSILQDDTGEVVFEGTVVDATWTFTKGDIVCFDSTGSTIRKADIASGQYFLELGEATAPTNISISTDEKSIYQMP